MPQRGAELHAHASYPLGTDWVSVTLHHVNPSVSVHLQAKAILAKANAKAEGLQAMLNMADPDLVRFYLALDRGLFTDMAGESSGPLSDSTT